jgi:hypothetical protein
MYLYMYEYMYVYMQACMYVHMYFVRMYELREMSARGGGGRGDSNRMLTGPCVRAR